MTRAMPSSPRSPFQFAAALLGALVVAGCAQGPQATGPAPLGDGPRDRVTASDESSASKRARVRLELATAYYGRGQLTTALDEVKLALAADPTLGEAFNLRGLIYSGLGDDALADDSFRRAIALNARDADSMHNYGWYLCQRKRYAEAATQFSQAVAVPQYVGVSRTLLASGVCQARAGNLADAESTLKRAFEADPNNPATAVNLAEVIYRRGDFERARFYIRRVNRSDDTTNAQTLWLAARIEMKLGNAQAANEFGQRLQNRYPKSSEAMAFDRGNFNE